MFLICNFLWAAVLYEQGNFEDVIAAYQKAINLDSSNANAYFNLAIALQQQG